MRKDNLEKVGERQMRSGSGDDAKKMMGERERRERRRDARVSATQAGSKRAVATHILRMYAEPLIRNVRRENEVEEEETDSLDRRSKQRSAWFSTMTITNGRLQGAEEGKQYRRDFT